MENQDERLKQEVIKAIKESLRPRLAKIADPKAREAVEAEFVRGIEPHLDDLSFRIMQIVNGGLKFISEENVVIQYRGQWPYAVLPDTSEHQVVDSQNEGRWIYLRPSPHREP